MASIRSGAWPTVSLYRFGGLLLAVLLLLAVPATGKEKKKPGRPVNLNAATVAELAELPGVGETLARRIVRHREKSGKFRRVEELLVIRGISPKKLQALRPYVTVEATGAGKERGEE